MMCRPRRSSVRQRKVVRSNPRIKAKVTALGSGTISGTLGNNPVEDIGLNLGDAVTIQTGDVKDWLLTDGQSMTGGVSISTLKNVAGKRDGK